MSKTYKYGVFGAGRIGKVHASIVREQGHQIVALGDEAQATTRFSFITTERNLTMPPEGSVAC